MCQQGELEFNSDAVGLRSETPSRFFIERWVCFGRFSVVKNRHRKRHRTDGRQQGKQDDQPLRVSIAVTLWAGLGGGGFVFILAAHTEAIPCGGSVFHVDVFVDHDGVHACGVDCCGCV